MHARRETTPYPGALESLAERAAPSWPHCERHLHLLVLADLSNPTSTSLAQLGMLVIKRHHILVRWSHWMNVPLLLGLVLSGISIYWSSPVYQHKPDPNTGNFDVAADIGIWIYAHVPGQHHYASPPDWIYNHMSLGPGM